MKYFSRAAQLCLCLGVLLSLTSCGGSGEEERPPGSDVNPTAFSFPSVTNTPTASLVTSTPVTISGVSSPVSIGVSNGEYSVGCGSTFTGDSGSISAGQTVCVRHLSAPTGATTTTTTLTVGGVSGTFSSTTRADDTQPDAYDFPPQSNAPTNSTIVSASTTITGIDAPTPISVSNGEYSIGCSAAFTATIGSINAGQTVCLRHQSPSTGSTITTTVLSIGGVSADFKSTTRADDTEPDPFTFASQENVAFSSAVTSAPITITGINTTVPISVTGGQYSIGCTSSFSTTSGVINNEQTVCVRLTSSDDDATPRTTKLQIGSGSATFTATTRSTFLIPYFRGEQLFLFDPGTRAAEPIDDAPGDISYDAKVLSKIVVGSDPNHVQKIVPSQIAYAREGRIYRVSLSTSASHIPATISSYNDVCRITSVLEDFSDPENSWLVLSRSGEDGDCSTAESTSTSLVRPSTGPTQIGVEVGLTDGYGGGLAAIHGPSGRIASILAAETSPTASLRRYEPDLQSSTSLRTLLTGGFVFSRELWSRSLYFGINTETGQHLLRYDESTGATTPLMSLDRVWQTVEFDADNAYLSDTRHLYGISHTATGPEGVTTLATIGNPDQEFTIVGVKANLAGKVAFVVGPYLGSAPLIDPNSGIWTVSANGSPAVRLLAGSNFSIVTVQGDNVFSNYFERGTANRSAFTTSLIDGSSSSKAGSQWLRGMPTPSAFELYPGGIQQARSPIVKGIGPMLRADFPTTGGQELRSVSPSTGAEISMLGTITNGEAVDDLFGYGRAGVLFWYTNNPSPLSPYDVYGFNIDLGSSLIPLQ